MPQPDQPNRKQYPKIEGKDTSEPILQMRPISALLSKVAQRNNALAVGLLAVARNIHICLACAVLVETNLWVHW